MMSSNVIVAIISAVVSATVSGTINIGYNYLKDKHDVKRRMMEKRLEKIYEPIMTYIETTVECIVCDNEYYGMKENEVEYIIKIIENNRYVADEKIIKFMEDFKEEIYYSQHYIRPQNIEYDPLYDDNRQFFKFIQEQLNDLHKHLFG